MKNILILTSSFDKNNLVKTNKKIKLKFNYKGRRLNENEILKLIDINTVGIVSGTEKISKKIFLKAKNLQVISRCGTGVDNIDNYVKKTKIKLFTTDKEPILSVAEFILTQTLSVMKNTYYHNFNIKRSIWKKQKGSLLSNKNFGIIGYGKIGKQLKKLISSFKCKLFIYDKNYSNFKKKNILKNLLIKSDIVTINIPYNNKNKNFINEEKINLMKNNAIFVNCSRGGLVDEKALYKKLKKNPSFKAILDCFSEEPYFGKLKKLQNVLLSPHAASFTKEGRDIMEKNSFINCVENLKL